MNKTIRVALPALVLAISFLFGCQSTESERSEATFEPIQGHLVSVERIREGKAIEVYGIVQPTRQSFVSGRVVGAVVAVLVEAGDVVSKGQELLKIQPELIEGQVAQAKGALAQAQAAYSLAEKNYQRFRNLHKKQAASDLELDMARMQFEQASGAVEQARGAVSSASSVAEDAVVRAPFAARIVDKLVEVGDLAAPGRPLVRLESLSGRKIWLTVRERDIRLLTKGQTLRVRFDSRSDLGVVPGVVGEIIPAADPATHTFSVKVSLGGIDLASGSSGRAEIPGELVERLVIPIAALHRRGGLELVVIRDEAGKARTRAVTTGRLLNGERVEVLSGLDEGLQVVVDAPGPVADGTPVEVLP